MIVQLPGMVQAMDVQLCDTSEDEDGNIESELESDEISEDERDYEYHLYLNGENKQTHFINH